MKVYNEKDSLCIINEKNINISIIVRNISSHSFTLDKNISEANWLNKKSIIDPWMHVTRFASRKLSTMQREITE